MKCNGWATSIHVLTALRDQGPMKVEQITKVVGCSRDAADAALKFLRVLQWAEFDEEPTRGRPVKIWRLA